MWQYNYSGSLYHHGILGQKWGKRNGPPYPLGTSAHSSSEKKADWRKSLDKPKKSEYNKSDKSTEEPKQEKRGLSDKQKNAIKIGAAAVVTALAVYGSYRLVKSGRLKPLADKGKSAVGRLFGKNPTFGEIKKLTKPETINEAINKVNPTFGEIKKLTEPETINETINKVNPHLGDKAYSGNCTLCAVASFLRQSGYDVTAGKTGGKGQNLGRVVEKCFNGAKVLDGSATKFGKSRQDAAELLVKKYGQNAEGVCAIKLRNDDCGHAFNWKIKDGVVSFFDGQMGYDDSIISRHYWKMIDPNGWLQLARLDGLEINPDGIKELLE